MNEILAVVEQYSTALVALVAAFGALGLIYRHVVRPTMRRVDAAAELIHWQLQENHGSSLVDKVNSLVRSSADTVAEQQQIREDMDAIKQEQKRTSSRLDRVEELLPLREKIG